MSELWDNRERHDSTNVVVRADKQGDGWANAHRKQLGNDFYLQDVDAMFGVMVFGHNTANTLFMEYVPDDYKNRTSTIREFGFVGMFDRKYTEQVAFGTKNALSTGVYLKLCRLIGSNQPSGCTPKFFFVIGNNEPPWTMIELDIATGKPTGTRAVLTDSNKWPELWEKLGLRKIRDELHKMLNKY